MKLRRWLCFAFCIFSMLTASASNSYILKTGEKFFGTEISSDDVSIKISTSHGNLEIKKHLIESIEKDISIPNIANHESKPEAQSDAAPKPAEVKPVEAPPPPPPAPAPVAPPPPAPPPPPEKLINEELFDGINSYFDVYKEVMSGYVPEGWRASIRFGYNTLFTNYNWMYVNSACTITKNWERSALSLYGNYEYSQLLFNPKTPQESEHVSVDKYAFGGSYKYNFMETDKHWYWLWEADLENNEIKLKKPEVDLMMGPQYTFKELEEYKINLSVSLPIGARYLQTEYYTRPDVHTNPYGRVSWSPFMYLRQDFRWHLHQSFYIDQNIKFSSDLSGLGKPGNMYSFKFMAGLVYVPTQIFNLSVRYTYEYDMMGLSQVGITTEERVSFNIEIPIGWK